MRLVDHAIAHGVNYFDTSPAYCRGHSEHATGVALSRHPRDKYFIATKLSNFAPSTWSREASMAMYRNSFRELQVDRIDYLLLHGVGMGGGMEEFEARYIDNGMLDFLLCRTRGGTHPQPRVLLPRRHRGLRPPARAARPLPVGLRADPAQLRRLAPRQGGQHAQYRCRIPVRRTGEAAAFRPSSWSRCWAGAFRMSHDHIAAQLRQRRPDVRASLRGRSASRGRSPAC